MPLPRKLAATNKNEPAAARPDCSHNSPSTCSLQIKGCRSGRAGTDKTHGPLTKAVLAQRTAGAKRSAHKTPGPARCLRPAGQPGAAAHSAFLWERRGGFGPAPCACSILARVYSAKPDTLSA